MSKLHSRILGFLLGIMLLVASLALASVSLSTGAVLPGWEQLKTGPVVDQAKRIILAYAEQVPGVACVLPDVHYREGAKLMLRDLYVDTWLESVGEITPLLEDNDQHVLLLTPTLGTSKHLVVIFQLKSGLLLVAC